jgi:hypothetical protein
VEFVMVETVSPSVNQARAVLLENGDDRVVLGFRETEYRMHLGVLKRVSQTEGKRVKGVIRATARRIDRVGTGGKYVEPVYGPPRRVAGRVVAVDAEANTITVDAGMPLVMTVGAPQQRATDFEAGAFVTMNVMPGATFSPMV